MIKTTTTLITLAVILAASVALAVFSTSESHRFHKPTSASGGGDASSTSFKLSSLISQTAIGHSSSAGYKLDHGFYTDMGSPFSGVGEKTDLPPGVYRLGTIYPNPFNPITTIAYDLPKQGRIVMKIYNMKGQLVRTLLDEDRQAGRHEIVWNGQDQTGSRAASGLYLLKMHAGDFTDMRKITLLK